MVYTLKLDLTGEEIAAVRIMIDNELHDIVADGRQATPFAEAMLASRRAFDPYVGMGYAAASTVKLNLDTYTLGMFSVKVNSVADEVTRFGPPETPYGQAVTSVRTKLNGYRAAVEAAREARPA